jgi:hypothetical protein
MTSIDTSSPSPWTVVRDDDSDTYQIVDTTEMVVASVPIGASKQDIHRQQAVRDLVVAAPSLFTAAQQALAQLNEPEPNLEACRALLWRAISAARGQN